MKELTFLECPNLKEDDFNCFLYRHKNLKLTLSKTKHIGPKQWVRLAKLFPNFCLSFSHLPCLETKTPDLFWHYALSNQNADLLQFTKLFALKEVNTQCKKEGMYQGYRPLHTAAYFGNLEGVKLLLELGADPFLLDYKGRNPLQRLQQATENQLRKNVMSYLLEAMIKTLKKEDNSPLNH